MVSYLFETFSVVDSPIPAGLTLSTASTVLFRTDLSRRRRRQCFSGRISLVDGDDSPYPPGLALSSATTA